jgi:hypothetical protein
MIKKSNVGTFLKEVTKGWQWHVLSPHGLRIRDSPSLSARSVGMLQFGSRVTVVAKAGTNWVRHSKGFVFALFLGFIFVSVNFYFYLFIIAGYSMIKSEIEDRFFLKEVLSNQPPEEWHHLGVSADFADKSFSVRVFLDGEMLLGAKSTTPTLPRPSFGDDPPVVFCQGFSGVIREAALWSFPLSNQQVFSFDQNSKVEHQCRNCAHIDCTDGWSVFRGS